MYCKSQAALAIPLAPFPSSLPFKDGSRQQQEDVQTGPLSFSSFQQHDTGWEIHRELSGTRHATTTAKTMF